MPPAHTDAAGAVMPTGTLPRNPTTGRPEFTLLADHLEGKTLPKQIGAGHDERDSKPYIAVSACAAGVLVFDKDTNATSAQTGSSIECTKRIALEEGEEPVNSTAQLPPPITVDRLRRFFTRSEASTPPPHSSSHHSGADLRSTGEEEGLNSNPMQLGKDGEGDDGALSSSSSPLSSGLNDPARVIILLENPKTPRNIGSILRALGCFGYASSTCTDHHANNNVTPTAAGSSSIHASHCMILFTGHRLLNGLRAQPLSHVGTDATNMRNAIDMFHLPDPKVLWHTIEAFKNEEQASQQLQEDGQNQEQHEMKASEALSSVSGINSDSTPHGKSTVGGGGPVLVHVTAVDLIASAHPLQDYVHPFLPAGSCAMASRHEKGGLARSTVIFVFGPEDGNLSADFLPHCDDAVYIPTLGSLNLSTAVTLMLYDRVAKLLRATTRERQRQQCRHYHRCVCGGGAEVEEEEGGRVDGSALVQGGKRCRDTVEAESTNPRTMEEVEGPVVLSSTATDLESIIMRRRNVNNRLEWSHCQKKRRS